MRAAETRTASGHAPAGWMGWFVFKGGFVAAVVAGGAGCSTWLGYDEVTYEQGDTTGQRTPRNPDCVPSEAPGPLDDACGAFVSAATGDDVTGNGTKAHPYRTLARGLMASKTVYACNAAVFEDAVTATGDVAIFGGLDCTSGWAYVPTTRTEWHAPADVVPLHIEELAHLAMRDVEIAASDAKAPGGSSIAILADAEATLDLRRCAVRAGRGADAPLPPLPAAAGMIGAPGEKGSDGCNDAVSSTSPGAGGQSICDDRDVSGGAGGPGFPGSTGADGSDGSPTPGAGDGGRGGKKQDATKCEPGHAGAKGGPGEDGEGAKEIGAITTDGYTGAPGEDGKPGEPGQGGGGGGGGRACWNGKAGPSGGGGGSGACGGVGGKGGSGGGASIGILSLGATLVTGELLITAGDGGKGADGAEGGPGGAGGLAGAAGDGDPTSSACPGGKGGDGGKGGRGGGGSGGPSIGIAYRGVVPPSAGVEIILGAPGDGGKGADPAGGGSPGVAAKVQEMN